MLFRFLLVAFLCAVAFCRPQDDGTSSGHTTFVHEVITSTSTTQAPDTSDLNSTNTIGEAFIHLASQQSSRQALLNFFRTNFPEKFNRLLNADEDITALVANQQVVDEALHLYQQQDLQGAARLFKNHTLRGSHSFDELKQLTSVQNLAGDNLPVTVTHSPNGDEVIHIGDNIRVNSRTAHEIELANGYYIFTE